MISLSSERQRIFLRIFLIAAMIAFAGILRVMPHPWNFTPIGGMALFSGAVIKDKRLAILFPMLALLAGDILTGMYQLLFLVYASFLVNVLIGMWLSSRRRLLPIAGGTLVGAIQFFLVTNFGAWLSFGTFPKTSAGLLACYVAGAPLFLNTLAGDALYATLLFGGFALAERLLPIRLEPSPGSSH